MEKSIFNNCCWLTWQSIHRRKQIDLCLSPCTKLTFKWTKDLHIKSDTLNLVEEESVKKPQTHHHRGKFPDSTPMAQALRSTIDKWDLIKLKIFYKVKDTVNGTIWQATK